MLCQHCKKNTATHNRVVIIGDKKFETVLHVLSIVAASVNSFRYGVYAPVKLVCVVKPLFAQGGFKLLLQRLKTAVKLSRLEEFRLHYMDGISEDEAQSLIENHLISPALNRFSRRAVSSCSCNALRRR